MNWFTRQLDRPFFIRLLHWEYWSFSVVYTPIYILWIGLCIRARSFFFFAASNPAIRNGGFLNESKKDIFPLIPPRFSPKTHFVKCPAQGTCVQEDLDAAEFRFPMIGKPDIGARGRGVQILTDRSALKDYVDSASLDFHIQEFVPFEQEAGIFYYRHPGETHGHISGIVRKYFLTVRGDGHSTVRQLLARNQRAILLGASLEKTAAVPLDTLLAAGEERVVVPIGNHARGTRFLDESHLIDEALEQTIDGICREIPGFYFGRMDIRFNSWEELRKGEKLAIIEINGAGSEPTHIYDPRHSIFFAWKEIVRHWFILWRISRANHRQGVPYLTTREGIRMFREDRYWTGLLEKMKK